jgi:hypothetical protein
MDYNNDGSMNYYINENFDIFNNSNFSNMLFISSFMDTQTQYDTPILNQVLNESLYDTSLFKNVITEEAKNELVTIKYRDVIEKKENPTCFISYVDFQDDDDVIQLLCQHCFDSESIIKWLTEESATCPVCRHQFPSIEKKMTIDASLNIYDSSNNTSNNINTINEDIPIIHLNLSNWLNQIYDIIDTSYYYNETNGYNTYNSANTYRVSNTNIYTNTDINSEYDENNPNINNEEDILD